jgi:hypothetical protein
VQYHFRDAIGGFFEFPTENARAILPPDLQPVEPHHGSSVLSVMAFDFHDSPVGRVRRADPVGARRPARRAGGRLAALGVLPVPPRHHHARVARARHRALAPAALHAGHLAAWERGDGHITIHAADRGQPIVDMTITEHEWSKVEHPYQAFMHDEDGAYSSTIVMAGQFSENEEERGGITIHSQAMTDLLEDWEVDVTPFRELWMRDGRQTFHPLQQLAQFARR